jgi:hypothetical protein
MDQLLDDLNRKGIDPAFSKLVKSLELDAIGGVTNTRVQSVIEEQHNKPIKQLLEGFAASFQNVHELLLNDSWFKDNFKTLVEGNVKQTEELSLIAELEAFGHLAQQWPDTVQIDEKGGRQGKTPDFKINDDLYVEVYCPDKSQPEKKRVEKEMEEQAGFVKSVLSRPIVGSNPLAIQFSTNKVIDKLLNAKRKNDQTVENKKNILWIDVKQKLKLSVVQTLPMQSVNYGGQTFIGSFGLWHAFYGSKEESLFPRERYNLKFSRSRPNDIYTQKVEGLFRERRYLSAAIISCLDGLVLFENPWSQTPLSDDDIKKISKLYQFRPEFSFIQGENLEACINHHLKSIELLLKD